MHVERFTKEAYAPPVFPGLRGVTVTVTPALHAFSTSGQMIHLRTPRFEFEFCMN